MSFDPLYAINYPSMPGLGTVTLTPNHRPMQAIRYDQTTGSSIPQNSVGKLVFQNTSATAWISGIIQPPFRFKLSNSSEFDAVAVAVTTAHTSLLSGAYPAVWGFFPHSDPRNQVLEYFGVPLIDFVDHSSDFKDPINLNPYSISDDIMLFLILSFPNPDTTLSSISIAQHPVAKNTAVSIFGYPGFTSLEEVYPLSRQVYLTVEEVKDAICGGYSLVRSEGVIKEVGDIHAVSCTAAGGMSGGPVVILENGIPRVAGMLCGGPAAPLHRTLIKVILAVKKYDYSSAETIINDLEALPHLLSMISRSSFHDMKLAFLQRNLDSPSIIMNSYIQLLPNYTSQADEIYVNHNLILPATSPGFRMAIHCSQQITTDADLHGRVVTYEFLSERLKFYQTLIP